MAEGNETIELLEEDTFHFYVFKQLKIFYFILYFVIQMCPVDVSSFDLTSKSLLCFPKLTPLHHQSLKDKVYQWK